MAQNDPKVGDGLSGTALSADHIGPELNRLFENLLAQVTLLKGEANISPVLKQGETVLSVDASELKIEGSPLVSEARLQSVVAGSLNFTEEQIQALQSLAQEVGGDGISLLDLQTAIDAKVAQADFDTRSTSVDSSLQTLGGEIDALEVRVDAIEALGLQAQIDTIDAKNASQDTAISGAQTVASTASVRSLANEGNITTLQSDLGTAEGEIDQLQTDLGTAQATLNSHTTQLSSQSASITAINTKNTAQDGRLDTAEADISALQSGKLDTTGTALKASRLDTPISVQLSGAVSGGVANWVGATNLSFSTTLGSGVVGPTNIDSTQAFSVAGLSVTGDLNVSGSINTVDSTVLQVEDASIFLRHGATTTGDASIVIEQGSGANDPEIFFDSTQARFVFRKVDDSGNATSDSIALQADSFIGDLTGQADTVASLSGLDADDLAPSATRLWMTPAERTLIGDLQTGDLSQYVTDSELTTALGDYVETSDLNTTLGSYYTSAQTDTLLGAKVDSTALTTTLADYVQTSDLGTYVSDSELNTALASYVSTTSLTTTLGDYVSSSSLTTTLADYVSSSSLTTTLGGYVQTSALSSYVTSSALTTTLGDYVSSSSLTTTLGSYVSSSALSTELSSYVTSSALSTQLGGYVTSSALTTALADYVQTSDLGSYLTASDLADYVQTSALSSYVTTTALSTSLADYVESADLTSTLSGYVTSSALTTQLGSYVTSSALSTSLGDYVQTSALNTTLGNYVTSSGLTTTLSGYVTSSGLTSALSSYVTSSALTTQLGSYVTSSALTTALSGYTSNSELTTALSSYVTTTALSAEGFLDETDAGVLFYTKSLSDQRYYTKSAIDTALAGKASTSSVSEVASDLSDLEASVYTQAEVDALVDAQVSPDELNAVLNNYSTTSAVDLLDIRLTTAEGEIDDLQNDKVDKVEGKGLSTEDFTTAEQTKLSNLVLGVDLAGGTAWKVDSEGDLTFGDEIDQHAGAWKVKFNIVDGAILFDYTLRKTSFDRFADLPDKLWTIDSDGDLNLTL